jgi:Flp pilus assembly protein protease CpaA
LILNFGSVCFFYSNIVLLYCVYRDISFRKIPNKSLEFFFIIGFVLALIEAQNFYTSLMIFMIYKSGIVLLAFIFSFSLFCLKIIGGSDGKLIVFLFFAFPILRFNFHLFFSFFSYLLILFLLLVSFNYLFTRFLTKSYPNNMLYALGEEISYPRGAFLKFFYKFLDVSQINKYSDTKLQIKSLTLFYNGVREKFQCLAQNRPPFAVLIFISYDFLMVNNLF